MTAPLVHTWSGSYPRLLRFWRMNPAPPPSNTAWLPPVSPLRSSRSSTASAPSWTPISPASRPSWN